MERPGPDLRPIYALADAAEVQRIVTALYNISSITACHLLNRGLNDVYEVQTVDEARFIFRIGNRRHRAIPNLDYEAAFLDHLEKSGVPVAACVAARDGRAWTMVTIAGASRPSALFRFLTGDPPQRYSILDATAQGITLARVHEAGRHYTGPSSNFCLDTPYLLHESLASVLTLPTVDTESCAYLQEFAGLLHELVAARKSELSWGHCHGDCHGGNARITEFGIFTRTAALFDFDDGGPGWLAYDLAVYLWNRALVPDTLDLWEPFLSGYNGVRPVQAADLEAVWIFVPIRNFWMMGEHARRAQEWGLEAVGQGWVKRQVTFLRDWQAQYLSSRLL
jgi:Ser/Thr protein kinase RdoA (MazF antagonist)